MNIFKIRSLYIKWIVLFTGLILLSQLFTTLFALRYILPEVQSNLSEKLYRKAVFLQDMHSRGMAPSEDILTMTGDTDINFYLFEVNTMPEEVGKRYKNLISLDMLMRAANGEIVSTYTSGGIKMPFCLMAMDNKIALLTPNYIGNELTFFVGAYQRSLIASAVCASVLIVFALVMVIRPIKKVSQATREVANGNFNVKLESRTCDEVGQLVHNFNVMTQALQKNEYLKKDFVSNVSHEFKTPITSIAGFARLMKNDDLSREDLNEYADIIIRESARLSGLSSNLLQLSLLDSDSFTPPKNKFMLDEQLRETILLLQSKWEEKELEFDIHMEEIAYTGPETLLAHVWVNLMDNAVKFSPQHGVITIEVKRDNRGVSVSITDEGPGIFPEHVERIFDRFYKADKSRSRDGSGLGLSIVKHILRLVNGTITVSKAEGAGACFTVVLPG